MCRLGLEVLSANKKLDFELNSNLNARVLDLTHLNGIDSESSYCALNVNFRDHEHRAMLLQWCKK